MEDNYTPTLEDEGDECASCPECGDCLTCPSSECQHRRPLYGSPTEEGRCAGCGRLLPEGQRVYCNKRCEFRDKEG